MILFAVSAGAAFAAGFIAGWLAYRSFFWNWVDLVYYPLAAVGVALLFLASDVQRELLDVVEVAEREKSVLADLRGKKPNVEIVKADKLLAANLEHIAVIEKWSELCAASPHSVQPRCLAVKDLGPLVQNFLRTARETRGNYGDTLANVCTAGDLLLKSMREKGAFSDLVAESFLAHFVKMRALELSPLAFETVNAQVAEFEASTQEYANKIHRAAFGADDKSSRLLRDVQTAEIDYGGVLLMGLSQCASESRAGVEVLREWESKTSTQQQEVAKLEARRHELKQATTGRRALLWMQLNLWPIVLLGALALKFAKGAAAFRKARSA